MPHFRYIGSNPLPVRAYGETFEEGKATELTGHLADKAMANPDFQLAGGRPRKAPTIEEALEEKGDAA